MAKKKTWSKKGIVAVIIGLIFIIGGVVSIPASWSTIIIGFIIAIMGTVFAAYSYVSYQNRLIEEKKKARAEEKQRLEREEQLRKEIEERNRARVANKLQLEHEEKLREEQLQKKIEETVAKRTQLVNKAKYLFDQLLQSIPRQDVQLTEPVKRNKEIDMPDISFKNITKKTNISKLFPLVVIDVETTGLKATSDIIEVAAIKYSEGFKSESCISMLCKPRKPIPEEATKINGITDDMVENCPLFSQVANSVSEYIKGCTIVGHNLKFDLEHLFVSGVVLSDSAKYYDTLKLARYVLSAENTQKYNYQTEEYEEVDDWDVEDYKLDTLCEHYGIYRSEGHRALSDCLATAMLFEKLIEDKTAVEIG